MAITEEIHNVKQTSQDWRVRALAVFKEAFLTNHNQLFVYIAVNP